MNVGYAASLCIGPLAFLYLKTFQNTRLRLRLLDALHFLPAFLVLGFTSLLEESFWIPAGYYVVLYQMILYLVVCWYLINRNWKEEHKVENLWLCALFAMLTTLGACYYFNFALGLTAYTTGPLLYSALVYLVSFLGLQYHHRIFINPFKSQHAKTAIQNLEAICANIEFILNSNKPFLDPALTMPKFARMVQVNPHQLSEIINTHYKSNFSDLINRRRIDHAIEMFSDPRNQNKKIAAIAFDAGFNSLSAFNASFKKFTLVTPSTFRNKSFDKPNY